MTGVVDVFFCEDLQAARISSRNKNAVNFFCMWRDLNKIKLQKPVNLMAIKICGN